MKIKNKILLTLGTVVSTTIPLVAVISCGDETKKTVDETKQTSQEVIELSSINTPLTLVAKLNEVIHFKMPENAMSLIASESKTPSLQEMAITTKAKIKKYMKNMNFEKEITINFDNKTYTFNFSLLKKAVQKLVELFDKEENELTNSEELTSNIVTPSIGTSGTPNPNMAYLTTSLIDDFNNALAMKNYLLLGSKGATIQTHEYLQLLREWHKVIFSFVSSDAYKAWISDKTFTIGDLEATYTSHYNDQDWVDENIEALIMLPDPENKAELSNFEALMTQEILNLRATSS